MRSAVILGAALLVGCGAHHGAGTTPVAALMPCPVSIQAADSLGWKLVKATGFTFCVPSGWRPSGSRGWRAEGASLEWTVGDRPQSTAGVRRIPVGIVGPEPRPEPRHLFEVIGGESAELWDAHVPGTDYTSAQWTDKRVYFQGKASSPRMAEIELMIYRTVRFNSAELGT